MSWITKSLTLDILAITIDGLNKIFTRIEQDPVEDGTPAGTLVAGRSGPTPAAEPETTPAEPATNHIQQGTPEPADPAPVVDTTNLLPEAQNLCRTIAQQNTLGGVEWVTQTLLPHFNVQSLTDVPTDRLPELITMATTHIQQATA